MQQRHAYSSLVIFLLVMWSMSPGVAAERWPLWGLAETICKLGMPTKITTPNDILEIEAESLLIQVGDPARLLWMPATQCDKHRVTEPQSFFLVIGKALRRAPSDANYYLASLRGELIRAVLGISDISERRFRYISADPTAQTRSEFEAEKRYWMAKYGLPVQ